MLILDFPGSLNKNVFGFLDFDGNKRFYFFKKDDNKFSLKQNRVINSNLGFQFKFWFYDYTI